METFDVEARDEGGRDDRAEVEVTISASSFVPPKWQGTFDPITIPEDTPVGETIRIVVASSISTPLTYSIVLGQKPETNNPKKFDLESSVTQTEGFLKVFAALDYEATERLVHHVFFLFFFFFLLF